MKVVSPVFYPDLTMAAYMLKSAKVHGLDVLTYGIGQPFVAHGADAQIAKLVPVLENLSDDYVLVTDCRDVLFLAGEQEIMDTYLSYDSRLVMSTEKGCWPMEPEVIRNMPKTPTGYNYINAGQYIGERLYIIECLLHLMNKYRGKGGMDNSQGWWPLALVRHELDFKLDRCKLFQTMSSGERWNIIDGKVQVSGFPCSIHFNGSQDRTGYFKLAEELYGKL